MTRPARWVSAVVSGVAGVVAIAVVVALPSRAPAQKPVDSSGQQVSQRLVAQAAGASGYAGSETCRGCHEDRFASYQAGPHGIKADPRRPAAKQQCETCHGPGKGHVDSGGGKGVGGIVGLTPKAPIPAETKNAQCLQCHAGSTGGLRLSRALWKGSIHETRGVACTNCHTVHEPKAVQPDACNACHKPIKAQLLRSSHHPIREGKIQCTDCHNPHGTVADKLISASTVNEKCYTCHAEKRGPFLWEHIPAIENCLTCHTPHGSSHDKLLVERRPWLCQTCHSNSRHPGTLYGLRPEQKGQSVYSALNNRVFYRNCQNCHSQIHGSNHPSGKALLR